MLEHGGRLHRAARHYGIALSDWLDLSTGLNPESWPHTEVPRAAWARLPEDEDGLTEAAQRYYGAPHALPTAGSQAAIMQLPTLRAAGRVGMLEPSYAEHALRWREAGHEVVRLRRSECAAAARTLDTLVLVNPNNPTGERFAAAELLTWHAELAVRGGWLVLDETFADADPSDSLAAATDRAGLIVLRSLGKFFGLAGARVGFVLGSEVLLQRLAEPLGPWTVTGPARDVARRALADRPWHATMRTRLHEQSARLAELLHRHDLPPAGGCSLFQWVRHPPAAQLHDALARQAILTRLFDAPPSLRFGLPGPEAQWLRLETALATVARTGIEA
jgi:L-threonine-O-3-phosphate decarboxylase